MRNEFNLIIGKRLAFQQVISRRRPAAQGAADDLSTPRMVRRFGRSTGGRRRDPVGRPASGNVDTVSLPFVEENLVARQIDDIGQSGVAKPASDFGDSMSRKV